MKNRIRLMHVVLSLKIGGLENLVLKLARKINKGKYEIYVCSLTGQGDLENEFRNAGIPVFVINKREGIDYLLPFRLGKLFKNLSVDIVHTHNITSYIYGTIGAKLAGIPVIHTEHSRLFIKQKRLRKAEKILSSLSKYIVAVTDKVAEQLIYEQGIPSNRIRVINNGIDTEYFSEARSLILCKVYNDKRKLVKLKNGINTNDLVLGTIGRLEPIKDHETLIKAFSKIRIMEPLLPVKLIIIGDGSLRSHLQNTARNLNIIKEVIFLGSRLDIAELMPLFDIFVLTSFDEGLPLTILEAMASGLPVIATHVGGIPDVVVSGETGSIVPTGSPDILAEECIRLLKDKDLRINMGEKGCERVQKLYNIDTMVRKYQSLYSEIMLHHR